MSASRLIVLEKTSHWATALRWALGGSVPRLVETRTASECQAALQGSPVSLVALEVTPHNLELAADWMVRVSSQFPQSRLAVMLTPEVLAAELLLREAGAIEAIRSVLEAPRIARLARRLNANAPRRSQTIHEFVQERMPWPGLATA